MVRKITTILNLERCYGRMVVAWLVETQSAAETLVWDSDKRRVILSKGSVRNSLSFKLISAPGHGSCPGSLYEIIARVAPVIPCLCASLCEAPLQIPFKIYTIFI